MLSQPSSQHLTITQQNIKMYFFYYFTGISATNYADGCTIHSWAGIRDERFSEEKLCQMVSTMDSHEKTRKIIMETDVLFIDEISMISCKLFNCIEAVCRTVRKSPRIFGGLQLVAAGDFFQLPPIQTSTLASSVYAMESSRWKLCLTHHVELKTIMRQTDQLFAKVIHQLERGQISTEVTNYLANLKRPLPPDTDPLHIYGTNIEANIFNLKRLNKLPGVEHTFAAEDFGKGKYLTRLVAPVLLKIKVNAKVMLLKNLSNRLVNGLQGFVKEVKPEGPVVYFPSLDQAVQLEPAHFTIFANNGRILAQRKQYPLSLAYGITVHKSQGLTSRCTVVDCSTIKYPGQLGVAVGRATSPEYLQVVKFTKKCVQPHPDLVYNFYSLSKQTISHDLTCCREVIKFSYFKNNSLLV